MQIRRQAALLGIMLCWALLGAASVQAQVDQRAIAKGLLAADGADRVRALARAEAIRPADMGPELRSALIEALEREGELLARREAARQRGEAVPPLERLQDPEFILALARLVIELRDPRAIPALAGALGTGGRVTQAVVDFGEQAVPAVVAVVMSPESSPYAISDGLIALRCMVEGAGVSPLSARTLEAVRRAVEFRLTSLGRLASTGGTLRWAVDLAVALDSPGLRRIVESLSVDPNEVIARGVTDPDLIARTQRHATERLAGVPARPPCR